MDGVTNTNTFNLRNYLKGFTSGYGNNKLNNNNNDTKKLCCLGVLSALVTVLSFVSIPLGTMKISIEGFPVFVAGLLFGPIGGMMVGGIGSLIYQFFAYGLTPTTSLWVLPHIFTGFWIGLLSASTKSNNFEVITETKTTKILFMLCVIITNISATLINSIAIKADAMLYGYYTETLISATIWYRLFLSVVKGIIYSIVLPALCKRIWKEIK